MDIVIKNGHVIDPLNNISEKIDIGIDNGKIVEVSHDLEDGTKTYDASGCYVVPGLIDYHTHISPLLEIGLPAEIFNFSAGVTTVVDAGSTGCSNFEKHLPFIASSNLTIKAFLNVCSSGMVSNDFPENIDPDKFNERKIKKVFRDNPNELLALKIRVDENLTKDKGMKPLLKALEIAEDNGVRLVVHSTRSEASQAEVIKLLRPGDVLTHCYHDFDNSIIGQDGKVLDEVLEARERGVIFDAANARFHFSFKIAKQAIKNGFLPDIISTDCTKKSMYKKPQIFNMMFLLSKYINMGLNIETIIKACTETPAKIMGMGDEIGSLGVGYYGDVSIIKLLDRDVHFEDWDGNTLEGNKLFRNMLTIKRGEVMFQDIEFN